MDEERQSKISLGISASESYFTTTSATTLGPLHGIPILLKNSIATADSMNNTGESDGHY